MSIFSQLVLSALNRRRLIVFGDSHSATFSSVQNVDVVHVGPATAHNLILPESKVSARQQIFERLGTCPPGQFAVVLAFGEIDCRVHLVKAASLTEFDLCQVVLSSVDRYFTVIQTILGMGYPVLVYGPAASGVGWDPQFPTVGREFERNYAIQLFNSMLRERCLHSNAVFASLDDLIIDPISGKTRQEFLSDGCHLNHYPNTATELQSIIFSRFLVSLQAGSGSRREKIYRERRVRMDHAKDKPFSLTSAWGSFPGSGFVSNIKPFFFHTDYGTNQGIQIDLLSAYIVDEVVIHNRTDLCQNRAQNLHLSLRVGSEPARVEEIASTDQFLSGESSSISTRFEPCLARFVMLYSTADTYLHFSGLEVLGDYPLVRPESILD